MTWRQQREGESERDGKGRMQATEGCTVTERSRLAGQRDAKARGRCNAHKQKTRIESLHECCDQTLHVAGNSVGSWNGILFSHFFYSSKGILRCRGKWEMTDESAAAHSNIQTHCTLLQRNREANISSSSPLSPPFALHPVSTHALLSQHWRAPAAWMACSLDG